MTEKFLLNGTYASKGEVLEYFDHGKFDVKQVIGRDKLVLSFLKNVPKANLLDVGCYAGSFSEYLNQLAPNVNVTSVDYFEDNIRMAKVVFPHLSNSFSVQSAYALDFEDEAFNFVTFKEVIEHIDRPVDAIRELNRVLCVGGFLFVSTPNGMRRPWLAALNSIRTHLFSLVGRKPNIKLAVFHQGMEFSRHIYSWIPKTLYTLLALNGFRLVEYGFIGKGLISKFFPDFADEIFFLVEKVKSSPTNFI